MKKLQRWRERDERPWREKELIFTHKILIYLLPLSYSAILHSKSHRSTFFFFFFFMQQLHFTTSNGVGILGLNGKIGLHLAFALSVVNALISMVLKTGPTSSIRNQVQFSLIKKCPKPIKIRNLRQIRFCPWSSF